MASSQEPDKSLSRFFPFYHHPCKPCCQAARHQADEEGQGFVHQAGDDHGASGIQCGDGAAGDCFGRVHHFGGEGAVIAGDVMEFGGGGPHAYIPAFNASLFLSSNESDVQLAIDADYPAGVVLPSLVYDDEQDTELRLAFDFDGVIADDESETVFKTTQSLDSFAEHETARRAVPHQPGPLGDLFRKLAVLRGLEQARLEVDPDYRRILRTSIVTARSAPSHERVITTLKSWGVSADEVFFLGGMEKSRVLSVLRPHMLGIPSPKKYNDTAQRFYRGAVCQLPVSIPAL